MWTRTNAVLTFYKRLHRLIHIKISVLSPRRATGTCIHVLMQLSRSVISRIELAKHFPSVSALGHISSAHCWSSPVSLQLFLCASALHEFSSPDLYRRPYDIHKYKDGHDDRTVTEIFHSRPNISKDKYSYEFLHPIYYVDSTVVFEYILSLAIAAVLFQQSTCLAPFSCEGARGLHSTRDYVNLS